MSDNTVTLNNLPSTTAGLEQALTILEEATGCPDSEVQVLLAQWDALVSRYSEAESGAQGHHGTNWSHSLPVRVGDEVYQAALL